jgi:ABC-type transport system involved in multi-copper enzyme maturation permease subunit
MLKAIIRREFLDNILSFKFVACVLVAIILATVSTVFLTSDYQARLKDYRTGVTLNEENLKQVPVYSYLTLKVFKKPNPLSIFVSGIERETGTYADITHRDIPASLRGGSIKNEFSHMFSFFDLSSVIMIVFTLLAILLSYNAITGEKEEGTLSLALANAVPRYKILLGKYLGVLSSLAVPLTLLFLVSILIVLLLRDIEVNASFFFSMTLLYGLSLLYLSSITLIGLFVSARTRKSFTSLLILLCIYLITVFLSPLAINGYAYRQISLRTRTFERNLPSLTDEREKAVEQSLGKIRSLRTWHLPSVGPRGAMLLRRITPPEYLEFYKKTIPISEKMMEDYAVKIDNLRGIDDAAAAKIRRWRNTVQAVMPSTNLARMDELAAETGEDNFLRFVGQLKTYWQSYVHYLDEKNAFGLRYFYPYSEEFTPEEKNLIERINKDYVEGKELRGYRGKYLGEALGVNPEIHNLDLSDLPAFVFHARSIPEKTGAMLPNIIVLISYNLVFLLLAHFSFNHYDPRRDA